MFNKGVRGMKYEEHLNKIRLVTREVRRTRGDDSSKCS